MISIVFILTFSRWYFRKIKRIEAEKKLLLPENEHGAFLIRDSESRHNDYSLSGECQTNMWMGGLGRVEIRIISLGSRHSYCGRPVISYSHHNSYRCFLLCSAWRWYGQTLSYTSIGWGWIFHCSSYNIQVIEHLKLLTTVTEKNVLRLLNVNSKWHSSHLGQKWCNHIQFIHSQNLTRARRALFKRFRWTLR